MSLLYIMKSSLLRANMTYSLHIHKIIELHLFELSRMCIPTHWLFHQNMKNIVLLNLINSYNVCIVFNLDALIYIRKDWTPTTGVRLQFTEFTTSFNDLMTLSCLKTTMLFNSFKPDHLNSKENVYTNSTYLPLVI